MQKQNIFRILQRVGTSWGAGYWSNTVIRVKRSVLFRMGLTLAFAGTNHGTIYPTLLSFLIVELAPVNMSFPVGAIWNRTREDIGRTPQDMADKGFPGSYVFLTPMSGCPCCVGDPIGLFLMELPAVQEVAFLLPVLAPRNLVVSFLLVAAQLWCSALPESSLAVLGWKPRFFMRSESQLQPFPRVVFQK